MQEEFVLRYVRDIRSRDRGIGGKKLWYMYSRDFGDNFPVGRDRFYDVLAKYGLKLRRKQRTTRTTNSEHGYRLYPNLVRDFIPTAPNQLWVSDISYIVIRTEDYNPRFCYLSLVLDAYSEEIVGWSLGTTLETIYPLEALRMALHRLEEGAKLIHHSDRGCQYVSDAFVKATDGMVRSYSKKAYPWDNACIESFHALLKREWINRFKIFNYKHAYRLVFEYIETFYNTVRIHSHCGYLSPVQYEEQYHNKLREMAEKLAG